VALLCAVRHPGIDLVGVSTVMGRVEISTWLAEEMLRRAEVTGVPVLPGSVAPLHGGGGSPDWLPSHGRLAPELPRASAEEDEQRVEAIAQAMIAMPEPFHLVTIGPTTNAARLLERHPGLAERFLSTTCMAGWLDGRHPEHNVEADPEAARLTFERLGPRLVGLEASSYTLEREEAEAVLDAGDPASAFLLDCYREYRAHADWHGRRDDAPLTLFDPITLLSLVVPELFDFQSVRALVAPDGWMRLTDDGSPVSYAMSCDWDQMRPLILDLLGGGNGGPVRPRGAAG
jgi:purine nucleosidase